MSDNPTVNGSAIQFCGTSCTVTTHTVHVTTSRSRKGGVLPSFPPTPSRCNTQYCKPKDFLLNIFQKIDDVTGSRTLHAGNMAATQTKHWHCCVAHGVAENTWSNENISAAISFRKNGVRNPTGYRISREVKG